jgi:hypothetical protein
MGHLLMGSSDVHPTNLGLEPISLGPILAWESVIGLPPWESYFEP